MNLLNKFKEALKHYPEITGVHPACDSLPLLSQGDWDVLHTAIKERGLANDLVLDYQGQLVDGRHRLIACFEHMEEPRFKKLPKEMDVWAYVVDQNVAHRHMTAAEKAFFGDCWRDAEEQAAKERQLSTLKQYRSGTSTLTANGQARDVIGQRVGVGGSYIDAARDIREHAPELKKAVLAGDMTLKAAGKEARSRKPVEKPKDGPTVTVITVDGKTTEIAKPKSVKFNKTTNAVDWARWTWNPVTGCEHGCSFCYAREIAHAKRMSHVYPFQFEPAFHEYRLAAPRNTSPPDSDDPRDGRVFVCSMADLFGKWVPKKWINAVFEACLAASEWEYLFLTKWPARYSQMPLLDKAWYGASIIRQSDVARVEKAMSAFETDCIKWISLEPMTEAIRFNDLSWCNLVVIGSQTATNQPTGPVPAVAPDFDWVVDVVNQCREAEVPYYLKDNLGPEAPGMVLPKSEPWYG